MFVATTATSDEATPDERAPFRVWSFLFVKFRLPGKRPGILSRAFSMNIANKKARDSPGPSILR
jgi:hypothetical protein